MQVFLIKHNTASQVFEIEGIFSTQELAKAQYPEVTEWTQIGPMRIRSNFLDDGSWVKVMTYELDVRV